ncbi:MAG TPA: KEOPS complex N(6)-L-threonylcarbamoyladenine synthase Kae1 [Nitrososphaera sp.]|nr:KEOPS complex N(6)-L-threonylcarbamoyladenine synthase Kae1 [Nitrososphaera sp.]
MLCLGVESTAHTFGCSIVDSDGRILSDARDVFRPPEGSGIHPRDASRHHIEYSSRVLKQALESAAISVKEIDIIGYSAGPGLGPCLRVGAVVSRALAGYHGKPLIPVNHALGHVELGALLTGASDPLVLLVSGGHSMILAYSKHRWRVFGETLDITVGQLLDQFGRGLGYASPCGGRIEEMAGKGSGRYLQLPYAVKGNDVSFSGLLTAALRLASDGNNDVGDICYSLQETAFAMLAEAVERALSFTGKKEMMIVGGVAANRRLAEMLQMACKRHGAKTFACPIKFAGDNGAQIAWTALKDYVAASSPPSGRRSSKSRGVRIEKSFVRQSWRLDSVDVMWRP